MSDETQFDAEREGPVPIGDMIAALGQFYIAILIALILVTSVVDKGGLTKATDVLQIDKPAIMANFTA